MMHLSYLATLLAALVCIGLVDRRWRLVVFADARRAGVVLVSGVVLFLVWDLVAVHEGFYRRGGATVMTGLSIAPGVPLEELFFVLFLCYVTVVMHGLVRVLMVRDGRTSEETRR